MQLTGKDTEQPDIIHDGTALMEKYLESSRRLPEEWREVMQLRVSRGLSYREIAECTGKSVAAVESILYRARERLYGELKDYLRNK